MTDLLEEFRAIKGSNQRKCKLALTMEELPEEDKPKLQAALDEITISHQTIETWIKRKGLSCSDVTVKKHRTGVCRCE